MLPGKDSEQDEERKAMHQLLQIKREAEKQIVSQVHKKQEKEEMTKHQYYLKKECGCWCHTNKCKGIHAGNYCRNDCLGFTKGQEVTELYTKLLSEIDKEVKKVEDKPIVIDSYCSGLLIAKQILLKEVIVEEE
ncbi:hypothetical protein CMI37_14595 [Candidatus Pacearchaeota archaeon]|nr:hypothetical protein [Candidatus Pacearchaeota archaeon]